MSKTRTRPGIKIDNRTAEIVRMMADMYLRGFGLMKICQHLESQSIPTPKGKKKWHAIIVSNILRNPLHAGLIPHEGEYIKGAHYDQRIYDPEVFYQILEQMKSRRRFGPQTLSCAEATLAQVARCDECGDRLRIIQPNNPYRSYRCEGPSRKGFVCKSRPYVRGEYLEPRVLQEIQRVATDPRLLALAEEEAEKMLSSVLSNSTVEIKQLENERVDLKRKILQLAEDHIRGNVSLTMLSMCDKEYTERLSMIDARLAELQVNQACSESHKAHLSRVVETLRDFPRLWEAMQPEEKRTIFYLLIESLRVGRGDGCIRVRLKLRFLDEIVFDLPVHSLWSSVRDGIQKPVLTFRQMAFLSLAADGYSEKQIAALWRVKISNVREMRSRAIAKLQASSIENAIDQYRQRLTEWKPFLPLSGRHGCSESILAFTDPQLSVLRGIAAGKTDLEMAEEMSLAKTTVGGIRNSIREKLEVSSKEAMVAKAFSLGLIRPTDPSPKMLLCAYTKLTLPVFEERLKKLRIKPPTARQIECLQALVDGLSAEETAQKMRVGLQSIVYLRMRIWRVVNADSLKTALERVQELGILHWPDEIKEVQ